MARHGVGSYSGDLVRFEINLTAANEANRIYCVNNSDQVATATLTRSNGQIVAQADFLAGETFVTIDGTNKVTFDVEGAPVWPFSIRHAWPA